MDLSKTGYLQFGSIMNSSEHTSFLKCLLVKYLNNLYCIGNMGNITD